MKKLFIILGLLLICSNTVFAVDSTQVVEDNKAVVAVQKQPTNGNNKQAVKNNWFSIVIVVNGKVKDTVNSESAR